MKHMQNRRANQEFEKQMFIEGGYVKIKNPHKAMGIIQQLAREDANKSAVKELERRAKNDPDEKVRLRSRSTLKQIAMINRFAADRKRAEQVIAPLDISQQDPNLPYTPYEEFLNKVNEIIEFINSKYKK